MIRSLLGAVAFLHLSALYAPTPQRAPCPTHFNALAGADPTLLPRPR